MTKKRSIGSKSLAFGEVTTKKKKSSFDPKVMAILALLQDGASVRGTKWPVAKHGPKCVVSN